MEENTKKSNNKVVICILIILVIVFAILAGVFGFKYFSEPDYFVISDSDNYEKDIDGEYSYYNETNNSLDETNEPNTDQQTIDKTQIDIVYHDDTKIDLNSTDIKKIDKSKDIIYYTSQRVRVMDSEIADEYTDKNVPQINLDYDRIKNLNTQILKYENFYYDKTEYFVNGDILSLLVYYDIPWGGDFINVYNIDLSNGNILSNEEMMYKLGLNSNEELNDKVSMVVRSTIENKITPNEFEDYEKLREDSLKYNYDADFADQRGPKVNSPLYINKNGKLSVIVIYVYPVGGDSPLRYVTAELK